jgi:hypothetical protein
VVLFQGDGTRESDFLHPTRLFIDDDGTTECVPTLSGFPMTVTDLKLNLMNRSDDDEATAHVACFLAHIVRKCRRWFDASQGAALSGYKFRWQLNVGIPSAGYSDDAMCRAFRRAACAAWRLAGGDGPVTIAAAHGLMAAAEREEELPIEVVPEVAAEVVGYARSAYRQHGLHLLVDVGATTVDVCGFILSRGADGQDCYSILEAVVSRHGAQQLHFRRVDALREARIETPLSLADDSGILAAIPESIRSYSPIIEHSSAFDHVDAEFSDIATNEIMRCVVPIKKRRDPNSPRWREGLPVFLCGGGSRMQYFKTIVSSASDRAVASWIRVVPFRPIYLPVPRDLATAGMDERTFQRLAVAYGLSFDNLDIGRIVPPEHIDDMEPDLRLRAAAEAISKDQV